MTEPTGRSGSGFELLPHTADVKVSAWAPGREDCLAQAVRAMVAAFADVRDVRPQRLIGIRCAPAECATQLVEVLEEAIYLIDAEDVVPVVVSLAGTGDGGLVGQFGVADRAQVTVVGPAPKAVTHHGLRCVRTDGHWQAEAVIDV